MSEQEREKRRKACEYICRNFSIDERWLINFQIMFPKYLDAFSKDNFKSAEKREMMRWDFYFDFQLLKEKMTEYNWNKKFLAQNGIIYKPIKNLFYRLFSEEERAGA